MRCADHLWEVDYGHFFVLIDHQIELVEITMDQAVLGELNDKLNQTMVDLLSVDESLDIFHGIGPYQRHDNTVTISIDRRWRGEASFIERLHEGVLFQRGDSRHVQPRLGRTILQVVSVVLNRPK